MSSEGKIIGCEVARFVRHATAISLKRARPGDDRPLVRRSLSSLDFNGVFFLFFLHIPTGYDRSETSDNEKELPRFGGDKRYIISHNISIFH